MYRSWGLLAIRGRGTGPLEFALTLSVAHGAQVHSYEATFTEHHHAVDEGRYANDDALYAAPAGTAVLVKHAHIHRHGPSSVHTRLHDHAADTWHQDSTVAIDDPPIHDHKHRRSLRTTLLLILKSSPMVEGIPAFFAAGKYGFGLIAVMALVFAISTIATYMVLWRDVGPGLAASVVRSARALRRGLERCVYRPRWSRSF